MTSETLVAEEKRQKSNTYDSIAIETAKEWAKLTPEEIATNVAKGDFIIDIYRHGKLFTDIKLQGNWEIVTTSRTLELPGTILVWPTGDEERAIFDKALNKHLADRGLTEDQIVMFKDLRFHGKYKVLPHAATILNNRILFSAFRAYRPNMTNKEYHEWRVTHKLSDKGINTNLYRCDRFMLSEFLRNVCKYLARKKREAKPKT